MCSVLGAGNPDTAAEERAGCAPREIRPSWLVQSGDQNIGQDWQIPSRGSSGQPSQYVWLMEIPVMIPD